MINKENQREVIWSRKKRMMSTTILSNNLRRTLSFSIKIKIQQKSSRYIGILIPVAIRTLCIFLFAACGSQRFYRYLFIITHSFGAKIQLKKLSVGGPRCPIKLFALRASSKLYCLILTQLRVSLHLYVVFTVQSLNFYCSVI